MWLFLAFLLVPIVEIALFIQVGGAIGLFSTLLIVVATAALGTVLVRAQGLQALGQVRSSFQNLQDPSEALAHGGMILFSGALLLTPGFFTDFVGFAFLVPRVRFAVFRWARSRISVASFSAQASFTEDMPGARSEEFEVVDGEYTKTDMNTEKVRGPSGWTKH